jgi:hypothetical protein
LMATRSTPKSSAFQPSNQTSTRSQPRSTTGAVWVSSGVSTHRDTRTKTSSPCSSRLPTLLATSEECRTNVAT